MLANRQVKRRNAYYRELFRASDLDHLFFSRECSLTFLHHRGFKIYLKIKSTGNGCLFYCKYTTNLLFPWLTKIRSACVSLRQQSNEKFQQEFIRCNTQNSNVYNECCLKVSIDEIASIKVSTSYFLRYNTRIITLIHTEQIVKEISYFLFLDVMLIEQNVMLIVHERWVSIPRLLQIHNTFCPKFY